MRPYICVRCQRELTAGRFVTPVFLVEDASYLVKLVESIQYYAHLECP